ncbi:hypothetical protein D6825_00240 [Candidatus Woesearchaeota archaeon]|nr:MAG: hypothetical protein D6825_00240 [Candidatus Woesearchaeota archaeon]
MNEKYIADATADATGMSKDDISKFLELHEKTENLLSENKISEAKKAYLDALEAYHQIQHGSLEKIHKDLAYEAITELFEKVNSAKERTKIPYNLIAAAILIVAFSIVVLINPSIVGFVAAGDTLTKPLNLTFSESGLQSIELADKPLSLRLSGHSDGRAKVFYKKGKKLELIVDTSEHNGTFKDVCKETCTVGAQSNIVELFVSVESGTITLEEIKYTVEPRKNTAPAWRGSIREFRAKAGKQTTIDLKDFFTDAEGDELVFLSTSADGLDVVVQDSKVLITPESPGERELIFIASDMRDVARVRVKIITD